MTEGTAFPDHVEIGVDGSRSLASIPPERISVLRELIESSNETPVAIPGCQWQWPFDVVYRSRQCHSSDLPLANVRLLVVGSTVNSAVIDVPDSILDAFIIVIVRITTDPIPVESFLEIVGCLLVLGMIPLMSMLAMSAGVDRGLSMVEVASNAMQRVKIELAHFVAIDATLHTDLFNTASDVFMSHQTRCVFIYHEEDKHENILKGVLLDGFNIVGSLSLRSEDLEMHVIADVASNAEALWVDSVDENGTFHEEQGHNEVFPNEEDTLEAIIDRLLPMEASESDWNHFAMFWIGNPIKFHHSVTYHNIEDLCCIRALYTATMLFIRFNFNVFPYACESRCKHPFSTL